ncbi:MAG: M60 family metallopeptidase [Clostridiales bacterium]|nr:M60 family metallopeptidase [Clostridiales bacterium]
MLAWEEVIKVTHTTYGLDNPLDVLKSRQNIRYMRMFANAFMYAAGSHIGVGYGSTGALVQGKPTSVTGEGNANGLFGWGIAHEIGHNMDRLGKAEITNNIYSLMMQTYDGKDNRLPSRLELSDKYEDIYKKVAVGDKGMSNDGFTQLGMYWQLHLAYDNGADDQKNGPLSFYNKVFKVYDSGKVNGFNEEDKFAVAASMAAEKDLTEFFTKWGMDLSDAAKAEMKNYSQEERKIQYLTDESRRYRLNGGTGIQAMEFDATASVADPSEGESNANKVKITIRSDKSIKEDLLGYEIFRDGKQIAFITDTTYEDVIGSANNKAFKYEVRAIDSLGNIVNADVNNGKVNAGQVRIEHDNVIDRSQYHIEFVGGDALTTTGPALTTTGPALILSFNKKTPVTGIRVKAKNNSTLPEGTFEIAVGKKAGDGYHYLTAKEGDFEFNEAADASKFITYFNKPGASSKDTRIWTYDADVIRITGENIDEDFLSQFDVEPLSYPGDNVAFEDYKVGIMGQDYEYDDVDGVSAIEEGTLVIVGTYRGDPLYNTIHIVGRYAEKSGLDEEMTYIERPINGELLMFAEVPEDGETSDISDGLFIFIPDVQKEEELQGDCSQLSVLPTEIMAKMYRYDTIEHTGTPRVTSTTLWYGTPSYDSMPEIILNQGATSLIQEDMYEEN